MHESGEWISAFTRESGAVVAETGSRRQFEWRRPQEFTAGWTQAASVMIPWVSWRDQIPIREHAPEDTEWVPEPKRNKKLVFQLLLSAADVEDDVRAVLRLGDSRLTRSLRLSNGEALWLAVRYQEMAPEEGQWIQRESEKIRVHLSGTANDFLESTDVATVVFTSELREPAIPVFVQVPLGRQHLEAEPSD